MSNLLMGKLDTIARCIGRIRETWAKSTDTPRRPDLNSRQSTSFVMTWALRTSTRLQSSPAFR